MQAKLVIENPRFVIKDVNNDSRYKYLDLIEIVDDGKTKIRSIVVIVDTHVTPHEVVTWMIQRKLTDIVLNEEVVYREKRSKY